MVKLLLSVLLVSGLCAGELSPEQKKVAKDGIIIAGYRCGIVTTAYTKWNGDIKVVCDNYEAMFIIAKHGGNWTVRVDR
ncbi:hypothetical protein OAR97_08170 [Arcobacteraceae bacterium]|nr:hypothetical protein [Arcobacteraceae bacterium]